MVYESFLTTITEQLQKKLGDNYKLSIHPFQKNNGVTLDGLTVADTDATLTPTIFINPYYVQYQHGAEMDFIIQDMLNLIQGTCVPTDFNIAELFDFQRIQSKIMFRIVHTASNQQLLSQVPHIPFMDLSVIFFLFLEQNKDGQMTTLIYNNHAEQWNKTAKELWALARKNTPREYPPKITNMEDMILEIAQKDFSDSCDKGMLEDLFSDKEKAGALFVLTNSHGLYGAACMLYKNVLKNFADYLGKDLTILPSSIHEVLITADSPDCSYDELCNMVTSINSQDVPYEDQLSNQVYVYTRCDDQIRVVSHGKNLEPLCK